MGDPRRRPARIRVLEDFMVLHRAMDVKTVQDEVRKLELEDIRYAAKILSGERGAPDMEERVIVEAAVQNVVVPTDNR